jgi:hypothetical protein
MVSIYIPDKLFLKLAKHFKEGETGNSYFKKLAENDIKKNGWDK